MTLTDEQLEKHFSRAVNRLAKWRAHYAGWMWGTRSVADPQIRATRDLFEKLILLRAEVSILTGLLIAKDVFTAREFTEGMTDEAEKLSRDYAKRWPGCEAGDTGMEYKLPEAAKSMEGWLP